jgi:hypothetical protein
MQVTSTSFRKDKRIATLQARAESESMTLHDRQESGASKAAHDLFALALREEVAWISYTRSRGAKFGNCSCYQFEASYLSLSAGSRLPNRKMKTLNQA